MRRPIGTWISNVFWPLGLRIPASPRSWHMGTVATRLSPEMAPRPSIRLWTKDGLPEDGRITARKAIAMHATTKMRARSHR